MFTVYTIQQWLFPLINNSDLNTATQHLTAIRPALYVGLTLMKTRCAPVTAAVLRSHTHTSRIGGAVGFLPAESEGSLMSHNCDNRGSGNPT